MSDILVVIGCLLAFVGIVFAIRYFVRDKDDAVVPPNAPKPPAPKPRKPKKDDEDDD
jgi:hypothetical protein